MSDSNGNGNGNGDTLINQVLAQEVAQVVMMDTSLIPPITTLVSDETHNAVPFIDVPYVPIPAGQTLRQIPLNREKPDEETTGDRDETLPGDRDSCYWSPCEASSFNLRVGPDYVRTKCKGPSPPSLMDVVGVE